MEIYINMNNNHILEMVNCFFPKPMQITILLNPNYHYQELAKDFIEKFATSSALGIDFIAHYYLPGTMISLHLHHNISHQLFELIGYFQLKNKFAELGIQTVKYYHLSFNSQPVGKKKVIIDIVGKVEINNSHYQVSSFFLIKIVDGFYKIIHQILNILI